MNLTFETKMSSVKKPLLFSHEHIVSRKRTCILLHTLSTHLCLYLSIHVISNHFTAKVTNFRDLRGWFLKSQHQHMNFSEFSGFFSVSENIGEKYSLGLSRFFKFRICHLVFQYHICSH